MTDPADQPNTPTLDRVSLPVDLKGLSDAELARLADELRAETIQRVSARRVGIWGRALASSN